MTNTFIIIINLLYVKVGIWFEMPNDFIFLFGGHGIHTNGICA